MPISACEKCQYAPTFFSAECFLILSNGKKRMKHFWEKLENRNSDCFMASVYICTYVLYEYIEYVIQYF